MRGEYRRTMRWEAESVWVAQLYVSAKTAQKLIHKHRLTVEEIEDAVVCRSGLLFAWHAHPERGIRALVEVTIRSQRVIVVLYPAHGTPDDCWNLGSAYRA